MNAAIARVLNSVLGEYCENLNSEQLNVSVFSGSLKLNDLQLRKDIFKLFGLPLSLIYGTIGELHVSIPWTSLTSSPLKISISNIFMLVRPRPAGEWNEEEEIQYINKGKISSLVQYEAINSAQLTSTEPGFTEKLITKLVNNIEVTISSIYLRYKYT